MSRSEAQQVDSDAESAELTTGEKVREQAITLLMAVVIALGIRAFVIEPFRIPSGSMLPTLLIGDHLFVNKFIYGPKLPFTDYRLPGLREPRRGDVVVFEVGRVRPANTIVPLDYHPELPSDDFVKRIVGLPGDKVRVNGGEVWINGEKVPQQPTNATFSDDSGRDLDVLHETLGDCGHAVLDDPRVVSIDKDTFTIKDGRYFMMGDNRDHSNDSRVWGTVRLEEFKGPAFILYWSWDVNGNVFSFLNPANWWSAEKRWDRIFSRVKCESPPT